MPEVARRSHDRDPMIACFIDCIEKDERVDGCAETEIDDIHSLIDRVVDALCHTPRGGFTVAVEDDNGHDVGVWRNEVDHAGDHGAVAHEFIWCSVAARVNALRDVIRVR